MRFFASPELNVEQTLAITNVTSATNTDGTGIDISKYIGNIAVVVSSSAASASDTLNFVVQMSEDNSSYDTLTAADLIDENGDAATFTQVTDAGASFQVLYIRTTGNVQPYVRVRAVSAGASGIDITFAAWVAGQLKYSDDN